MSRSRDILLYIAGQIFQQGVIFGTSVMVARWLGPKDFGLLSLTRSIYYILLILAPLGLDFSLFRHIAQYDSDPSRINSQIALLRVIVGCVTGTVLVLTYLLFGHLVEIWVYPYPHFSVYLSLTLLALPVAADIAILGAVCRARHQPATQVLTSSYLQPAARLSFIVLFLSLGYGLAGVLIGQVIGTLIASVTLSVTLRYRNRRQYPNRHKLSHADVVNVGDLLRDSKWLALSLLVYGMLRFVDVMILGIFRSSAEVGEYAAISAVAQVIQFFPQSLSQTLGADVARHFSLSNLGAMKATLSSYLRHASILAAPVFAGVVAFGPWLDLVFGQRFAFKPDVTLSLAAGCYISAVLGPMGFSLSMTGRHRLEFVLLSTGTAITIGGCLVATPVLGAFGTALAVALGYLLVNAVRAILVYRIYQIFVGSWRDILPSAVALAVAFATREVGVMVLGRSFPSLIVLCIIYSGLCAGVFWLALLQNAEKSFLVSRFSALRGAN
jgi:O-antigen/teichoic acid export membrane protein